ncbi:CzcE family metal-binding protein [Dechloromonas hortensis]|uniref:CzcE family metal-binding protein n=1 Tax=Dechloromonas hortensis TaxID=337779 RepID=UPI001291D214|nr:CzcE family metal-binding protein [Dechloromonas hortensis]
MKTKFSQLALIAALSLATVGTSYAHEDYSEGGANHWLSHVSETKTAPTANQLASFGYAATKNADREVTLPSGSKYLNVTRLETIKINVGGKSVVWTFDTLGTTPFPLSKIVSGADDITVYVTENPVYQRG